MRTLAGAFTTLFPKNALSMIQASTSFVTHEQKLNIIRFRREPNTDWLFVIINIAVFAQILVFVLCLAVFFRRGVGKAKLVLTCRCVYVFVSFLRYRTGTWTWLLAESKVNEAMRWNADFRWWCGARKGWKSLESARAFNWNTSTKVKCAIMKTLNIITVLRCFDTW